VTAPHGPRERWDRHRGPPWHGPGGHGDHGNGPPWRHGPRRGGWRGFGCLFGLVFLLVAGSLVAASAAVVSNLGPVPGIVAIVVVLGVLIGLARAVGGSARTLDRLVDATRRVERGDYTVRVEVAGRAPRSVRQLVHGFDTMVERLEVDERQRRSLLADISHELRTPLTVIAGNLEAMVDGVHPADPEHLGAILEETRVMERLIDDLRTVALSEAGTLQLHLEPTDPDVLIAEVTRSFEGAALAAGVTVTTEIPADLPIADLDPIRMREVLANLLANAIRHTPSGGSVTVRGEVTDDQLGIRVVDTGPGIDADVLPHVFDRFVKGEASRGSGLGLAIARHLVVAHGGTLEVEATGSAGTTFRATLPIATGG
jgi:two-component system sensor histidine kinase BaeS